MPVLLAGIAGQPAAADEGDKSDASQREEQPDGVRMFRQRHVRAGPDSHGHEYAARYDQIGRDQQAHCGKAVAVEGVEPAAGGVEVVSEVAEDGRRGVRIGSQFVGGQPLGPLGLVLVVKQSQYDPDWQPAEHVPAGGVNRVAVRPEGRKARCQHEGYLNGETRQSRRGGSLVRAGIGRGGGRGDGRAGVQGHKDEVRLQTHQFNKR